MTNEKFMTLYESYLSHAWVTSKDASKAAEQKRKQQEYNRKYYQNNKDKWHKETESQGLGTGTTGKTYRFRDERDRKENASAMARQAAGDIKRQKEQAEATERWQEKQRQQNLKNIAQNARRELGTKNLKSNEAKGMEQAARARRNRAVTKKRNEIESENITKTRKQQNTRNKVKQKQIKESNVREDTFRTSSQRRKTGAQAEKLARDAAYVKADQATRARLTNNAYTKAVKQRKLAQDRKNSAQAENNAYTDAVKQRKLAQDRKKARTSPVQMGFRELSIDKVRSRTHSANASGAEQNARDVTSSNRKIARQQAEKARNTSQKVKDYQKNSSSKQAAAYAITRSLERQVRLQKAGKSSYPSKTTPRNKKNKGPK